jgi:hypothetical protein
MEMYWTHGSCRTRNWTRAFGEQFIQTVSKQININSFAAKYKYLNSPIK